jgi:VCBS repeat-containing protein
MAKTYKILVNDGKGTDIKPVSVLQGIGETGQPVRMVAKRGWRFELQDELKGRDLGPDQLRIKRMGKDLGLMFDGSKNSDVVIEDFYADNTEVDKDNGMPTLVGLAENGGIYEYVPQDPSASSMPSALKDGNTPVIVSLGGGPLTGDFVLAGLPLIAAAGGGFGGWLAGGALLAAAVAGGSKGGGGSSAVLPSGQTGHLTHDALNDTGVSITDSYTKNNKPQLTINAEHGATVVVHVGNYDYDAKETSTPGVYTVSDVGSKEANGKLDDGVYTPIIKVTNSAGTSTANGEAFTVDSSATKNQPNNQDDPNKDATIEILAVSEDTGTSANDFVTTDTTVIVNGKVTGFSNTAIAAGERVHVQILNATGRAVAEEYMVPAADGTWVMSAPTDALAKATYSIKATIEDIAGNEVKLANHALVITDANVKANPDTNSVTEDASNLIVSGGLIAGGLNGVGADEATSVQMSALKVSQVKADAGSYISIGLNGQTTINGVYGTLRVMADGTYSYELRNSDANVQALHNTPATDTFTYTLSDGLGHTSETTLTVTINGQNDVPTFSGLTTKQISQTGPGYEGDQLVISDADQGESLLAIGTVGTEYSGQYGTFKIIETTTSGTYNWTYTKPNKDLGASDAIRHDLFVVKSLDGTASQTIDISVDPGSQALTKQQFHALTADGLKVSGSSATTDTLIMNGSGVFDFTQALNQISSVERLDVDPAHTSSNTVKLNMTSLIQADGHVLTVLGDATDSVTMIGSSFTSKTQITTGSMAGFTDYKYLASNNDELHLFVQSLMNQTGVV